MLENTQLSLADVNDEYKAFVDKFKPKKTTDDCYTPQETYEAIKAWAVKEYGIDPENIVRPFWPGGDYEREYYPEGCTVVDNPPFSILTAICSHYQTAGIKFFLFAPYLTCIGVCRVDGVSVVVTDADITYENGAKINTSFVTNLDPDFIARSAPDLEAIIEETEKKRLAKGKTVLPKYKYPPHVLTSTMLGYMAKYGVDFRVRRGSAVFIQGLASQKAQGKTIFGGGLLLSEKAAAEKAAAENKANKQRLIIVEEAERARVSAEGAIEWMFSPLELEAVRRLGGD